MEFKQDPRDGQYKTAGCQCPGLGIFHSLGFAAGDDFPFLLFADQMGESVENCRGKAGLGWLRLLTDVPTALRDILNGNLSWNSYIASINMTQIESVFCREDPIPFLMEILLLPYFFSKKYIL